MKIRFLFVSNRLPVVIQKKEGGWEASSSAGGLVTALKPVLKRQGGDWIGWAGDTGDAPVEELLAQVGHRMGCSFYPVRLSGELVEGYYYGFSNRTLWPLFHDLLSMSEFEGSHWQAYLDANRRFAAVVAGKARPGQVIWVHDYQLMMAAHCLRQLPVSNPLAYFLHIPFPSPDIYRRLPWRRELLEGLLHYGLIGFQTLRDLRNFRDCVRVFVPGCRLSTVGKSVRIEWKEGRVRAGAFPISIDFEEFDSKARSQEVQDAAWYIHEGFREQQLLLGIDRLDYSKGIPAKFLAFERALEKYPDLQGRVTLIQLVAPSRQAIPEYAAWKEKLDEMVGRINGRFAARGWVPLHYMYRSLPKEELLGYYRACEIALVTSLKDGMNLVCKEYCACSAEGNGVLILSEFAGAAPELKQGALIVNPYHREAVADSIRRAVFMPGGERRHRMRKLRRQVRRHDVHAWIRSFTQAVQRLASPA